MITSKGQVTIPKEFRDLCGLQPHTQVEFVYEDGKLVLHPFGRASHQGMRIVEALRGKGDLEITTNEIMKLTRGED